MTYPRWFFLLLAALALSTAARAQTTFNTYRLTRIDEAFVNDVNEKGEMVGSTATGAVLLRDGMVIPLAGAPPQMVPLAINDLTQIMGVTDVLDASGNPVPGRRRVFLWEAGQIRDLGIEVTGFPLAINNKGQIVGSTLGESDGGPILRPFVWEDGRTTFLAVPDCPTPSAAPWAINDNGVVVGFLGRRAAMWRNGEFMLLEPAGFVGGVAVDVNDRNEAVGFYINPEPESEGEPGLDHQAFVWREGVLIAGLPRLDEYSPGAAINAAIPESINNEGQIVGRTDPNLFSLGETEPLPPVATLWQEGAVVNLNELVRDDDPLKDFVTLGNAIKITASGLILAEGLDSREGGFFNFLLTPDGTLPATVAPATPSSPSSSTSGGGAIDPVFLFLLVLGLSCVRATKSRSGLFILAMPLLASLVVMNPVWAQNELSFTRQDFGVGDFPLSVAVGDFNSDGRQDLATANELDSSVSILLGRGDGTFQAAPDVDIGVGQFSVTVGDFNGDGRQDLATANVNIGTVSVLLGNGDGTFDSARDFGGGLDARQVVVGDFNGDGREDLATANFFSRSVSILLGNGDGTFSPAQDIEVGVGTFLVAVTVGDFNGDGRQDLATANEFSAFGSPSVSILLGRGDGTFPDRRGAAVIGFLLSLVAGDFNGDGRQDLATLHGLSPGVVPPGVVFILLGNGDGTFQDGQDVAVGAVGVSGPVSIIVGDFNGDGQQDLATANPESSSVSILLGNGNGTFQPAQDFGVANLPLSLTVGDFNGDGRQDVATSNGQTDTVSILINNTAVEIAVKIDIKPGSFPNSINPRSKGVIPVAVLTTDTFDASAVDPTTVLFGATGSEAAPVHSALEDVDADGNTDMILHFRTQAIGVVCGDTSASLTGRTLRGQAIEGSDSIRTVGCK